MKKRLIIGLVVGATVFATVFAMAATLGVTSNDLAAGDQVVAGCDPDGVTTSYTTAFDATDKRYEVTDVTVSGIAAGCNGQKLAVTLRDTTNTITGSSTAVTVDATSETVSIDPDPAAAGATAVHVVIAE